MHLATRFAISALALAIAGTVSARDLDKSLSSSSEGSFLKDSDSGWRNVAPSRYQTIDDKGSVVEVAFGKTALQQDIDELVATRDRTAAALAHSKNAKEKAGLANSLREIDVALAALRQPIDAAVASNAKSSSSTGVLLGCSANVSLTANFNNDPAIVYYANTSLNALVQEFGPYGQGAGTVTLVSTAGLNTTTQSGFMRGISSLTATAYSGPTYACDMKAKASIVPACNGIEGYRSVTWTTTCDAAAAGTPVSPVYGNYNNGGTR